MLKVSGRKESVSKSGKDLEIYSQIRAITEAGRSKRFTTMGLEIDLKKASSYSDEYEMEAR
jgi:hypothetical protein